MVRVVLHQPGTAVPAAVLSHGQGGHGLNASGHDAVRLTCLNLPGSQGHSLERRGTEAVHGKTAGGIGQARPGRHQPGRVEPLLGLRDGTPQNHILHQPGVQLGNLLHHALEDQSPHVDGMQGPQGPFFAGFCHGGAAIGHHHRFTQRFCHITLPPFPSNRGSQAGWALPSIALPLRYGPGGAPAEPDPPLSRR